MSAIEILRQVWQLVIVIQGTHNQGIQHALNRLNILPALRCDLQEMDLCP